MIFKHRLNPVALAAIAMIAVSMAGQKSFAGTMTVTTTADEIGGAYPNGDCSLREAIMASNSNTPEPDCPVDGTLEAPDTIVLPAGTYTLTRAGSCEDTNVSGDLDITEIVNIEGAGASSTIITNNFSDESDDRIIDILIGAPPPMDSLKSVEKLVAPEPDPAMTISGVTIVGGSVPFCDEVMGINDGGGVHNGMPPDPSFFNSVKTPIGMPLFSVLLSEVIVAGNHARDQGGGISNANQMRIEDSAIVANSAERNGGGIYNDGNLVIVNSTISGNEAYNDGGGIAAGPMSITDLRNATVTNNTADISGESWGRGGGFAHAIELPSILKLRNTILAGNRDATDDGLQDPPIVDCTQGLITSQGFNLIGNNLGCQAGPWLASDQVGDVANGGSAIDPMLLPIAMNDGPTPTHALADGSPAIDKGNNVQGCTSDFAQLEVLTSDQRGKTRPSDGNSDSASTCDVGAYEYQPPACGDSIVNGTDECDDGNTTDGDGCSATCTNEVTPACGDGILQQDEACDDGNQTEQDGCSSACALENTTPVGNKDELTKKELTYLLGQGGCSLAYASSFNAGALLMLSLPILLMGLRRRKI